MSRYVVVHERMQSGYRYELTELTGRNFNPDFLARPDGA